jgi:hypothetical protein
MVVKKMTMSDQVNKKEQLEKSYQEANKWWNSIKHTLYIQQQKNRRSI